MKHLPNFLQEVKTAVRSWSPATADHRLRNCHSPAAAVLHLHPDFLFPAQFSCHLQGLTSLPALPASSAPAEMPTHALTHLAGTGRAPHPAQTRTLCAGVHGCHSAPSSSIRQHQPPRSHLQRNSCIPKPPFYLPYLILEIIQNLCCHVLSLPFSTFSEEHNFLWSFICLGYAACVHFSVIPLPFWIALLAPS